MKTYKMKILSGLLILVLGICIVSTQALAGQTVVLAQNAEAQAVGGYSCAAAFGVGLALGVASLTPCGILCATAGWYMLLALNYCD
jgi:hypothetical protein